MASNIAKAQIAEERRSQMLQMRLSGATERQIAQALSVNPSFVHKEIKRRLGEVRREDKEAVDREWRLQNARYERLLLRWWPIAIGETDTAGVATDLVLKIMRQMNETGGLIPEKPLIQINQDNRQQTLVFKVVYDDDGIRSIAPAPSPQTGPLYPPSGEEEDSSSG